MPRKILVVHESHLLRKIVASYAQAELSDLIVELASTAEEGLRILKEKNYDVVVSTLEMQGMDGLTLFREMAQTGSNSNTPFLLMTSTDTPDQRQRIFQAGIVHVLVAPFTGKEFAAALDRACNPREKRAHDRFGISDTEAVIHIGQARAKAKILNISRFGAYCELTYRDEYVQPLKPVLFDVFFSEEYGSVRAEGLKAAIMRLHVMAYDEIYTPKLIRVAYQFIHVPEAAGKTLATILERAGLDYSLTEEKIAG
jgi:CheY-like chemotaxis protein